MIDEDNKKNPLCPVCLEILMTNLYFVSDGHLYHKNCSDRISLKVQYLDKFSHKIYL